MHVCAAQSGKLVAKRFSCFHRDSVHIARHMDEYLYCRHSLGRYAFPTPVMEGDGFPVPAILTLLYFHQTGIRLLHLVPLAMDTISVVTTSSVYVARLSTYLDCFASSLVPPRRSIHMYGSDSHVFFSRFSLLTASSADCLQRLSAATAGTSMSQPRHSYPGTGLPLWAALWVHISLLPDSLISLLTSGSQSHICTLPQGTPVLFHPMVTSFSFQQSKEFRNKIAIDHQRARRYNKHRGCCHACKRWSQSNPRKGSQPGTETEGCSSASEVPGLRRAYPLLG
jgi:hypothetical protein